MTLGECFLHSKIDLFAALPIEAVPIRLPRLLRDAPWGKTVIFAAIPYAAPDAPDANLARFARVRDYHAFAAALTKELCMCIPETRACGFADHSPFDEVEGACLASLGVRGDNGLLITEKYSSYVFLYTLVTECTLAQLIAEGIPTGEEKKRECLHCGACRRACPGGCIGAGRDTCLSHLNQKKGVLTEAETSLLLRGAYAWGCDACQEACPYTKMARERGTLLSEIPYFREEILTRVTADDIAAMSAETYKSYAFGWRPKEVLLRNLTLREGKK